MKRDKFKDLTREELLYYQKYTWRRIRLYEGIAYAIFVISFLNLCLRVSPSEFTGLMDGSIRLLISALMVIGSILSYRVYKWNQINKKTKPRGYISADRTDANVFTLVLLFPVGAVVNLLM